MTDYILLFENWLRARNRAEDTITRYLGILRDFLAHTKKQKGFKCDDVDAFLSHLKTKTKTRGDKDVKTVKGSYQRLNYYALKTWFRSLKIPWTLEKEDVPKLEEPKRLWYTFEEITKLFDYVKKYGTQRDWLLLRVTSIAFSRRKSQIVLRRVDYDTRSGVIKMPSIKRGRQPVIELDPETRKVMDDYLLHRSDSYTALFPSRRSRNDQGTLYPTSVNRIVKAYCKAAGVLYKGTHAFRRGMVTYFFKRGLREREIFEMGDWKSEAMVSKYVQLAPEYSQKAREAVHPFYSPAEERPPSRERKRPHN